MDKTAAFLTPAAMEGQGAYNRSSQVQATGLSPALQMFERAASRVPVPAEPLPIVIADYGSSQGRNSLTPVRAAINILRSRIVQSRPITVVHIDLPENDFTVLFQTITASPESYLRNDPAVFASAVGKSFYEQILPPNSAILGWSSWAVQWLSRTPAIVPDHVQVALSQDVFAQNAFSKQAAEDWKKFLLMRGLELCPGGRLVILAMAKDDNDDFGYRIVLDAIYTTLINMRDQGGICAEELERMVIPTVGRTRADLLAPIGVDGCFGGLRVEELEMFYGEDRIWSEFERSGDPQAFGAQWAAFARASVFPTLAGALNRGCCTSRAAEFVERLERGTAARLATKPDRVLIPLAKIVLVKEE